jgi:cyclopropane-fatty-acyl-phospholipid synthase
MAKACFVSRPHFNIIVIGGSVQWYGGEIMQPVLDAILRRLIALGRLTVRWPDGRFTSYGGPPGSGPQASLSIGDRRTIRRLVLNPLLGFGEAYMDGALINTVLRRIDQYNPARRAQRNVAHHYDLNGRLYSLFLDRDRQYSCAYFPRGDETLEQAQAAKKRHIAAKLCLDRPDLHVLDIGCGWGGLALTLAREHGARVTGITLSAEQLAEARSRAAAEGLTDRVSFEMLDYRALTQRFDRIVSVGMFEHVGVVHYRAFFDMVARCLEPDGVALLHAIGRSDGPTSTNPWIAKYIFPGGYCPALSEVFPPIESSGLVTTDVEILRLHYAETLRHWRRRFAANRDTIGTLYDERFCRMFEFYLAGSEIAFRREGHMVFQIQLAHRQTAAPLTRDYITDTDRQIVRASAPRESVESK